MIKVIIGKTDLDKFYYTVPPYGVEGKSRQPLLSACRQLKSMGIDTRQQAGLFREGSDTWDVRVTSIEAGAGLTIREGKDRSGLEIRKYEKIDMSVFGEED